jgi:hypothetical protein
MALRRMERTFPWAAHFCSHGIIFAVFQSRA